MSQNSNEPVSLENLIKEAIEKSLKEEHQETSNLPMYLLIFNLLLLFIGFCWYFMQSSSVVMIDSLWPLIFEVLGAVLLIYQLPLFFVCRTDYQLKTKRSFSTFMFFNVTALCGFLLFLHPFLHTYNAFGSQDAGIKMSVSVVRAEYQTGSSRSPGRFVADILIPNYSAEEIRLPVVGKEQFLKMRETNSASISVFNGALGFRWLKLADLN